MLRLSLFLSAFLMSCAVSLAQDAPVAQTENAPQQSNDNNGAPLAPSLPVPPSNNRMEFSIAEKDQCKDCRWIVAEGNITSDVPDRFIRFIKEQDMRGIDTIKIHSADGDILAAIAFGRLIRAEHLNTFVARTVKSESENGVVHFKTEAGICDNACLLAYMGGKARGVEPGSMLSLRTLRAPLDEAGNVSGTEVPQRKQQLADIAYILSYGKQMGFNRDILFVDWQNAKPHLFAEQELHDFNIIFNLTNLKAWSIMPRSGGVAAVSYNHDQSIRASFYCNGRAARIFEVSMPTDFDQKAFDEAQKSKGTMKVLGQALPLHAIDFKVTDKTLVMQARLLKFDPAKLVEDDFELKMDNAPEPLLSLLDIKLHHLDAFQGMAKIALRACLLKNE